MTLPNLQCLFAVFAFFQPRDRSILIPYSTTAYTSTQTTVYQPVSQAAGLSAMFDAGRRVRTPHSKFHRTDIAKVTKWRSWVWRGYYQPWSRSIVLNLHRNTRGHHYGCGRIPSRSLTLSDATLLYSTVFPRYRCTDGTAESPPLLSRFLGVSACILGAYYFVVSIYFSAPVENIPCTFAGSESVHRLFSACLPFIVDNRNP